MSPDIMQHSPEFTPDIKPPFEPNMAVLQDPHATPADLNAAWTEVIEHYTPKLRAAVRSFDSGLVEKDDVLQDALISAMTRINNEGFEYRGPASFGAWLCTIARCKALDATRREALRGGTEITEAEKAGELPPSPVGVPESVIERDPKKIGEVMEQLRKISPRSAQAIIDDLNATSHHELREKLGLNQASLDSLLYRAYKAVRREAQKLESGKPSKKDTEVA